jgi:hypothetical protein
VAKDASAKVADLGGAVLHQLMRESGAFSAEVTREMARR